MGAGLSSPFEGPTEDKVRSMCVRIVRVACMILIVLFVQMKDIMSRTLKTFSEKYAKYGHVRLFLALILSSPSSPLLCLLTIN